MKAETIYHKLNATENCGKSKILKALLLATCLCLCVLLVSVKFPRKRHVFVKEEPRIAEALENSKNRTANETKYLAIFQNQSEHEKLLLREGFRMRWSTDVVELYRSQLGLPRNELCDPPQNSTFIPYPKTLVTSLPGASVHDHIWEYVSLVVTSRQNPELFAAISSRSHSMVSQLLTSVIMPVLDSISSSSYDLTYARILGNTTPIKPLTDVVYHKQRAPYLMEERAMRYEDVIDMGLEGVRRLLSLNARLVAEANKRLAEIRDSLNLATEWGLVLFAGVYVTEEDTKFSGRELTKALNVIPRPDNATIVSIIVCEPAAKDHCIGNFSSPTPPERHHTILMQSSGTTEEEIKWLVLLSTCNRTIVLNNKSILHAMASGSDAVVVLPKAKGKGEYFVPSIMSRRIERWHLLQV